MKFSKLLSLCIVLLCSLYIAKAQTPVELHITHKLSGMPFAFNTATQNSLGNDFNVTRLEYYVSKISIKHDGGMVTPVPNHYILANGSSNVTSALGSFNITNIESVSFHIGVDTPINHADPSLQPNGHPLAPKSPSMHWGWASGYRFVAVEGKSGASLGQVYEVHALGDKNYFEITIPVAGISQAGKIIIPINADFTQAFKGINLSAGLISHGEDDEAAILLNNFKNDVFYAGHPVSVATTTKEASAVSIYPNPSNGAVTIGFNNTNMATVQIYDVQGRLVTALEKAAGKSYLSLHIDVAGLYFLKVTAKGNTSVQKLEIL